jgi:chromosomal replication initiator protein
MLLLQEKWLRALALIKNSIDKQNFDALFVMLEPKAIVKEGSVFILGTPTQYHIDKLVEFKHLIIESLQSELLNITDIHFEVNENLLKLVDQKTDEKPHFISNDTSATIESQLVSNPLIDEQKAQSFIKFEKKEVESQYLNNLNPRFTFDNYLVCQYNELIHSVSIEVVNNPGITHNPMFVYSPVGLGKTHISQAIASGILEVNPSFKVKYISAESFKQSYVKAINQNKRQAFIDSFMEVDFLIMDDIQSLCTAEGTQAVFFQIYNNLYQNNKQMIITSDRAPFELNGFTDRLISRFNSGIVLDIESPNLEDRISILRFKLEKANISLSYNLIEEIAENIDYSIREIESVVNSIRAKLRVNPNLELKFKDLNYLTKTSGKVYTIQEKSRLLALDNPAQYQNTKKAIDKNLAKISIKEPPFNKTSKKTNALAINKKQSLGLQLLLAYFKINTDLLVKIVNCNALKLCLISKTNTGSKVIQKTSQEQYKNSLDFVDTTNQSLSSDFIVDKVVRFCNVSKEELFGTCRQKDIVKARQFCMWLLKSKTNMTLKTIGILMGNKNHATVIHSLKKVESEFAKKRSEFKIWALTI